MTAVDTTFDPVLPVFASLLGQEVRDYKQLRSGRNTRVCLLTTQDCRNYCGKMYFRHGADQRDRLGAEFNGLCFLWKHGVRSIPQPLAADYDHGVALYEFVHGKHFDTDGIDHHHIQTAVNFLAQLKAVSAFAKSESLPMASEAVFSVQELTQNIQRRLQKLQEAVGQDGVPAEFDKFVTQRLPMTFEHLNDWVHHQGIRSCLAQETPEHSKTLSPSDFGFHNALQRPTGEVVFLDFEYFGWDDVAKTICDFLLHPAMELGMELKRFFFEQMIAAFVQDISLAKRVELLYPLFGLKWCVIFLNEFLPEHLARRRFSGQDTANVVGLHLAQLAKSERMLQRILDEYEHFPYRIA